MAQSELKRRQGIYFPHFADMRRNPSIQAMRIVHGEKGYGWFWILVEMMRELEGYALPLSGKYSLDVIAGELKCDNKEADRFISDCIEVFHLFDWDGDSFWYEGLQQSMALMEEVSEIRRAAANKRWGKSDPDAFPARSEDAYALQTKEKKAKETERERSGGSRSFRIKAIPSASTWDGQTALSGGEKKGLGYPDKQPLHIITKEGVEPVGDRTASSEETECNSLCFIKNTFKEELMEKYGFVSEEEFIKLINAFDARFEPCFISDPIKHLGIFLKNRSLASQ
ncbi:MAG: DUF4373 domain-containing protein [Bacteroidota bacterium]